MDSTNLPIRKWPASLEPPANLSDRPVRVLGNERLRIGGRRYQRWQIVLIPHISKGHAHISQESAPLDSLDGRPAEEIAKPGVVQREVVSQSHA